MAKIIRVGDGATERTMADPGLRDAVETAARALDAGELVALPTETVYGVGARVDRPEAIERLRRVKGRRDDKPFTWHLADPDDADQWVERLPPMARRLMRRYWPGPVTLVLQAAPDLARGGNRPSGGLAGDGMIGLRTPARAFTRAVIRRCGVPLVLSSANRSGEPPMWNAEAVATELGDRIDWIFDGGPSELREASTVVRVTGDRLEILRTGILAARDIIATASSLVLLVCTGNTCRSPMAEALLKHRAAAALGTTAAELPLHGLVVASAGMAAYEGDAASTNAVTAMQELGVDLSTHRSRPVNAGLIDRARVVYTMTSAHRDRLLKAFPAAADKIRILGSDGADIVDPFGMELERYRIARDALAVAIDQRLPEVLALRQSD